MALTILCKVVDNFGDIGVAWRMSKRFVELAEKENPKKIEKINLVVDGLEAFFKIEKLINSFSNVSLIGYGSNDGISKAINTIAEFAKERNSKWLLTLDQDSVCQFDMIYKFKNYVNLKNM